MISSIHEFRGMIQPFKTYLFLSIAILISLSRGKSTKTRKTAPSSLASKDYKETCFDVEKERCENFEFYCGTRSQFMSNYCMLTCKMCVPGDPVTDLSSKCGVELDKRQETLCLLKEWVTICPHTCREFICDNKEVGCEALAKDGGCVSEHKYMTENCKLTCAMCTPGDPVMDLSSECNPKQALCQGDLEWQSICPHTCSRYLQRQAGPGTIPPPQNLYQPQVAVQPPRQQAGSVVQQPQQPVQQQVLPNQPQVAPQVGPQAGTAVQTSLLQPQVQQPVIPSQSQTTTQPAPQVTSLTQPSQLQPQIQQGTSQVHPAMQTSQGQPQIQPTLPQMNAVPQPLQGQPMIQQATPQLTSVSQTAQPQIQTTAPQVTPVIQANQLQPQTQPTVPQGQPLNTQQQAVQQPNQVQYPTGQLQAPQTSYQPQVNPEQSYQPVIQQPQFGTVGPMKKQKETNPAKGSTILEKTSNSKEAVNKGTAEKVNFRWKMKAADGRKAKDNENTRKGKNTDDDLMISEKTYSKKKKLLTRLKEESGSAAVKYKKKTSRASDKG